MPNFSQITPSYTDIVCAAPSGPGMPDFSQITLTLYALHLSNCAAPSGPGMPYFFSYYALGPSIDLLCTQFSHCAAPNGPGMPIFC